GGPPGPTPLVSVPPEVSGIRIVVRSGERVDLVWTIPAAVASVPTWLVGCHIPGHWAQGMQIPVRWAAGDGTGSPPPSALSVGPRSVAQWCALSPAPHGAG